jgi:electron transfer flavoprotein alpha subunit
MTVVVYLELVDGGVSDPSLQALTLARELATGGSEVHAVIASNSLLQAGVGATVGAHGVGTLHVALDDVFAAYAPAAAAQAVAEVSEQVGATAFVGAGTERGNEVLAHVAARRDLTFAANCVAVTPGQPLGVTRVRWGGSLLEEARVHGATPVVSVQPHAVAAAETGGAAATVVTFSPSLTDADRALVVRELVEPPSGGVSLADAKVVVSCGRGAGSPEGFAGVEEVAARLGGAVGCSRAVTMAGWRPHTDQVGQTGTKIAPDVYIACGISGATQHMAGCKGAKTIIAVNIDPEAPILQSADYAVIGDLHEVVPAIAAAIRDARGT